MYPLATIFPWVRRFRIPLSRDQVMLLMLALNQLLLGVETYTAHIISGTVIPKEWIPILFGPIAAVLLLLAGGIAFRKRFFASVLASLVFLSSLAVGLLGAYYHLARGILPTTSATESISLSLIIWAPPLLAPLAFALIALLGLSSVWIEDPPDSGILNFNGKKIPMPFSKTRAFFFMSGMGCLVTVISASLDHARGGFSNPWVWYATAVAVFATTTAIVLALIEKPTRSDLITYAAAMALMALTGVTGSLLHIQFDLTSQSVILIERFVRGAPPMAPMLFADMGAIGLIALLNPEDNPAKINSD